MTAQIVMNDGTGPVIGSLVLPATKVNTPVTLSNFSNVGVLGWKWEIRDTPVISPTLYPPPPPVYTNSIIITPDVKGHSILVRLTTYKDAARTIIDGTDQKILGVRFDLPYDWLIPAAGETLEIDVIRGWATNVNEFMHEVRAIVAGISSSGFDVFKEIQSGETITVPPRRQVNVDGRVRMNGHLVLNGHLRTIGRRRTPRLLPLVSGAQEIPNNCIALIDPSSGPFTLTLLPRGTPGEVVELISVSDAPVPPPVTVDGVGPLLSGSPTRQITTPREYLRLRRNLGNNWSVI